MTKKNKKQAAKQQQKRQQKKQARRATRVNQRAMPLSIPRSNSADQAALARMDPTILQDIRSLLPVTNPNPSDVEMEPFYLAAMQTEDLADEPEFEELLIDPLLAGKTYFTITAKRGHSPEDMEELMGGNDPEELQEIIDETIYALVAADEELPGEIYQQLNRLRARFKRTHPVDDVARVAALQFLMTTGQGGEKIWPVSGLIQKLFHRSLAAGAELFGAAAELEDHDDDNANGAVDLLADNRISGEVADKVTNILNKIPGLHKFVTKQTENTWNEGLQAVRTGELDLDLFSKEEGVAAIKIFSEAMTRARSGKSIAQAKAVLGSSKGQTITEEANNKVIQLILAGLTPEKIEHLNQRILELLYEHREQQSKWVAFLGMLKVNADSDPDFWRESPILMLAMFGEIRNGLQPE